VSGRQNHFVAVYKITVKRGKTTVHVADPAHGLLNYSKEEFCKAWLSTSGEGEQQGICLLLEPSPDFYIIPKSTGFSNSQIPTFSFKLFAKKT